MNYKLSIITPSFNQGRFIEDTIKSVLAQNYSNYEHIIIDGGSTDVTLEVIKKYPHLIWISEKDNGAADAINKGFEMARGEVLAWINSDDYYEENIFKEIMDKFNSDEKIEFVCGNLDIVNLKKETIFKKDNTFPYTAEYLIKVSADIVKQQPTFFTKKLYNNVGGLNKKLKLVFDYELFVKMLLVTKPAFIEKVLAYQREYETTLTNSFPRRQAVEIFNVSRKYGSNLWDKIHLVNLRKLIFPKQNSKTYLTLKRILNFKKWKYLVNGPEYKINKS